MTPLHHACKSGDLSTAKRLVERGADVHATDMYHMTTLAWSAKSGRLDIVKYLLELAVGWNIPDVNGISPVQHAAKSGHLEIVDLLVDRGASVDARDHFGMTSLSWAARSGHLEVAQYLVERGADVNALDRHGVSVVHIAIKACRWKVVKYLVGQGADLASRDANGMTSLQRLIKAGRWSEVKLFLAHGAMPDSHGDSGLASLVKAKKWDLAKCLVSRGAAVTHLSADQKTAFLHQVIAGAVTSDTDLQKALSRVIKLGNVEMLKFLLEHLRSVGPCEPAAFVTALSKSYEDMKVKNVVLTCDMERTVEDKIILSRFFSERKNNIEGKHLSLKQVKEFFANVCERVEELTAKYLGRNGKKVDEILITSIKYIACIIHVIKKHLRRTYSILPWEEIEFCLINFLHCAVNSEYSDEICRLFVDKDTLLTHLRNFCAQMNILKESLQDEDINSKGKLSRRSTIVDKIVTNNPEFETLYKDYDIIKNIYSLKRIYFYVELATSVDVNENYDLGKLVIQRALQVIGEGLKSTPESPNVSEDLHEMLLHSAPRHTKEIITCLRDILSHADTLTDKIKLEEEKNSTFFQEVQNDLKKVGIETTEILYKKKIEALKLFLKRILSCPTLESLESLKERFFQGGLENFSLVELRTEELERVEELIEELRASIRHVTPEQENLIKKMKEFTRSQAEKLQKLKHKYDTDAGMLFHYGTKSSFRAMKNLAQNLLYTLNVSTNQWKKIVELGEDLTKCIADQNVEFSVAYYKILCIICFKIGKIQGMDDIKQRLSRKNKEEEIVKKEVKDTFARIQRNLPSEEEKMCFKEETETRLLTYQARETLINHLKNKIDHNDRTGNKNVYTNAVGSLKLKAKTKEDLNKYYDEGEFDKCLSIVQRVDDKYATLLKTLGSVSPLSEKYIDAFKVYFSEKHSKLNLSIIFGIVVEEQKSNIKQFFDERLSALRTITEREREEPAEFVAMEMLVLDLCEILEHSSLLADNKTFLLGHSPVLVGKSLRNYLAHGDPLVDLLPVSCSTAIVTHALTLLEKGQELITGRDHLIGSACAVDVSETRERHIRHLQLLATQRELFSAAGRGDLEAVKHSIGRGADPTATNIDGLTALDFAVRADSVQVFKFLVDTNISIDLKHILLQSVGSGSISIIKYCTLEYSLRIDGINFKDQHFLHCASLQGETAVVEYILDQGEDVNCTHEDGITALHLAALNDRDEVVRVLLKRGAKVNAPNSALRNALHLACDVGSVGIVRLLLKHGAEANVRDKDASTPLHIAAYCGRVEVVEQLLEAGADVNARDNSSNTAMSKAFQSLEESEAIVLALVEKGALIDVDDTSLTPLHYAAKLRQNATVQALLDKGVDVNVRTNGGLTPLHFAAEKGDVNVVKTLLSRNAEIDAVNERENYTALHCAAAKGHKEVVEVLLSHNAQFDATSSMGHTALHAASLTGQWDVVSILLKRGVDIECRNLKCETPLHLAVEENHMDTVELLINEGASVNASSNEDVKPLHVAAKNGFTNIASVLLANGAEVEAKTGLGNTPLHIASESGSVEIVSALLATNADVNARNKNERTPLHMAAGNARKKVVAVLKEAGANVNAVDCNHRTPLMVAVSNGDKDVVEMLVSQADAGVASTENETALFLAATLGFKDVVSVLLSKGADVNIPCHSMLPLNSAAINGHVDVVRLLLAHGGVTTGRYTDVPLVDAATNDQRDVAVVLLDGGQDVNAASADGETALHRAASRGHDAFVRMLTERGAHVGATNHFGATPLHVAAATGRGAVVQALLDAGADASAVDGFGATASDLALERGYPEVAAMFVGKSDVTRRLVSAAARSQL